MGMIMVQKMGGKALKVISDSKLVVGQVRGDLEARDSRMQEYLCQIRSVQEKFEVFDLSHIPRSGNTHADSLATLLRPRHRICPEWYWLKAYLHILQYTMVCLRSTRSNWVRVGWISYHYSWKKIYCLKRSLKLRKYEETLLGFGYPRIENYTSALSLALIYFMCTPKHQNHF